MNGTQARGGLSKAVEALGSRSWSTEPKLACPRPRPVNPARSWVEAEETEAPRAPPSATVPTFTTSASPASTDALAELRRLFASECSLGTSAPGFGVSPPVRSGAANGLVHDSLWRAEAPRTCKASLRVLQERAGPRPFTSCAGDYRLLMASPDQGVSLLAGAVEGEEEDDDCGFGAFGFGPMLDDSRPPSSAASAPPPPRTFSLASSRASPVGSQAWYSGAPAHSPSPDPDSGLLFSY